MTKHDQSIAPDRLTPMQVFLRRVPPHVVVPKFLGQTMIASLLELARSNEAEFEATMTYENGVGRVNSSERISKRLRNMGAIAPVIEAKVLSISSEIAVSLGMPSFEASEAELELVAHGDGAFFKRHVDPIERGSGRRRMISAVYYFNAQPKNFTGGALRLLAFEGEAYVDIEPNHDTLVLFPSWVLHEVLPVSCPSGQFVDSRFAINCWILRDASGTSKL